jgi:hypothetical protein
VAIEEEVERWKKGVACVWDGTRPDRPKGRDGGDDIGGEGTERMRGRQREDDAKQIETKRGRAGS